MEMIKSIIVVLLCNSLLMPTEAWIEWVSRKIGFSPCHYIECCNKEWKDSDFEDLKSSLSQQVYGQEIALEVIVPALRGHILPSKPKSKALVMSFHGRPGVGKNYVATFIQKKLFEKHGKSKYVHFFSGRSDFPLQSQVQQYRTELTNLIKKSVSQCEYSLFIFDEVDKMPPGVLDALVTFIDHHEELYGIDFRKSTYILISNTGGDLIAQKYLEFWKSGKKRETLRLAQFEDLIMVGAFNDKGSGLYKSDTIEGSLIDHYVPFLPLEEEHVRQCVRDQLRIRKIDLNTNFYLEAVLSDVTFGPVDEPIFSNSGCKRISPKVAALAEREHYMKKSDL